MGIRFQYFLELNFFDIDCMEVFINEVKEKKRKELPDQLSLKHMDVLQFLTWALFETGINCALFLCKLR
jgi:hypothetical protein